MSEQTRIKLHVNLDYRVVILALLAIIVVMFIIWKPWATAQVSDRTVDVTGQATVSARPDEFVFYPAYDFKNTDRTAALKQMTAKSEEVVGGLKKLGVADKNIKTNSDGWGYPTTRYEGEDTTTTYTLRLTVTVNDDELTQKVQDYLVSTAPTGSISPQATFSEAKLKEVEAKGRDLASKEARAKADQSAKNLGFRVGSVKSVNDAVDFGGIYPLNDKAVSLEATGMDASLAVQPGENDLSYTVTVTYYIK